MILADAYTAMLISNIQVHDDVQWSPHAGLSLSLNRAPFPIKVHKQLPTRPPNFQTNRDGSLVQPSINEQQWRKALTETKDQAERSLMEQEKDASN